MPTLIAIRDVVTIPGLRALRRCMLRTTRRVIADGIGIHIETYLARHWVAWAEVERIERYHRECNDFEFKAPLFGTRSALRSPA